jgi:molybdopterin-binding protein
MSRKARQPGERQDQGWRRNHTAAITDETVEQLNLQGGKTAYAVIKMSDFMVELD